MRKDLILIGLIGAAVVGVIVYLGYNYGSNSGVQRIPPSANSNRASNGTSTPASAEALVRPDSPSIGPADAKVTIVEFYDPECESCAAFAPAVKRVVDSSGGRVRLVLRYMPLHPNSLTAATFTEAAGEQGKYWEAHDMLFAKQPEWGTKHGPSPQPQADVNELFRKYADELKLDSKKMDAAFAENRYAAKIDRDKKDGQSLGVRQTPTIFVNGRKLTVLDERALKMLVDQELQN